MARWRGQHLPITDPANASFYALVQELAAYPSRGGGFDPAAGERLNLTGLLAGAPLANDLANLGAFISVVGQGPDPNGGTDTTLSLTGPGGGASLVLVGGKAIAAADLLNDNALVLPPH